jgi:precorrin-8X/cobalt-precorrin-8 methylmutase
MDYTKPEDIETRSFEIIDKELEELAALRGQGTREASGPGMPRPKRTSIEEAVIRRVIHATADFDFDANTVFTHNAAEKAHHLLHKESCTVVTDTNMVLAGLNKTRLAMFGGSAFCFMADEEIALAAKKNGSTRAQASVDRAANLPFPLIYAVGNAPTALLRIAELHKAGIFTPSLVIASPVGFVNVVEAKELFLTLGIPSIITRGRKGGSAVAAAILNALLYFKGYHLA